MLGCALGGSWVLATQILNLLILSFGVDPGKKVYTFWVISSNNRNPEPKKVLKYSTPKPSIAHLEE